MATKSIAIKKFYCPGQVVAITLLNSDQNPCIELAYDNTLLLTSKEHTYFINFSSSVKPTYSWAKYFSRCDKDP